jgi:hypothetical protein
VSAQAICTSPLPLFGGDETRHVVAEEAGLEGVVRPDQVRHRRRDTPIVGFAVAGFATVASVMSLQPVNSQSP